MAKSSDRSSRRQSAFTVLALALLAGLASACAGEESGAPPPVEEEEEYEAVCVDEDGDGYGRGCDKGRDCDDDDPDVTTSCPLASCSATPTAPGCECDDEQQGSVIDCGEVYQHIGDQLVCGYGIQICDEGKWSACKFSALPANQVVQALAVAGPCEGNPCDPNCREFNETQNYTTPQGEAVCAPDPSCNDGEQNQGEQGVDCEGPCAKPCPPDPVLISADFNFGYSGFIYLDDTFRATSSPSAASGSLAGGHANLTLGMVAGAGPNSGGFRNSFTSDGAVTVSFDWQLDMPTAFLADECVDVMVTIDGVKYGTGANDYVTRVCDGGTQSGTFTFESNFLSPGPHDITFGGYLNKNKGTSTATRLQVENYLGYNNPVTSGGNNGGHSGGHGGFETSSDTDGTLNMGWTDNGDWVEWEFDAPVAGDYLVQARIAGGGGTWSNNIVVDGAVVATLTGGNTGGWQVWKNFTTSSFQLTQGSHILRLQLTSGNQNINWIDIVPPATGPQASVRIDNVVVTAPGGPSCGDAICEGSETCESCVSDCGDCPLGSYCGDATCDPDESCLACATDCGICFVNCGNGVCDPDEGCGTCESDCGTCPESGAYCGDASCDMGETCTNCETDCGVCRCGDETCDAATGEDCLTCAIDCNVCAGEEGCGDAVCDPDLGETCSMCATDCGACPATGCGDGTCGAGETCSNCVTDCGDCAQGACGNGTCGSGETCSNCAKDCGACPACGDAVCNTSNSETCSSCTTDCGSCPVTPASTVWLEAECAVTKSSGYATTYTTKSGYVGTGHLVNVAQDTNADTSPDRATYSFNVAAGTYKLWFRVLTDTAGVDDSWFYRIDGGAWNLNNNVVQSSWGWVGGGISASGGSAVTHSLSEGTHTLEVRGRENGLAIDRIYITKNGDTPSGNGNSATNCSGSSTVCGDNSCSGGETCSTCAKDCGKCAAAPVCGDASCNGTETCTTCESDCGSCPPGGTCGNNSCSAGETCSTCAKDCGVCAFVGCGDHSCNAGAGEDCATCAIDCGPCLGAICTDGICDTDEEDCLNCPSDCGGCPVSGCADAVCNAAQGENCSTCVSDCGVCAAPTCGNGACDSGETCSTCAKDCGQCPWCGDAVCNNGETCSTCVTDCGACATTPTEVWLEAECANNKWGGWTTTRTTVGGYVGSGYVETTFPADTSAPAAGASQDHATFNFTIAAGTYKVYFRAANASANDDSWYWRIDGGAWNTNNNQTVTSSFIWYPGQSGSTTNEATVTLTAGAHTLEVYGRENGWKFDRVAIKAAGLPSGNGTAASNCSTPVVCGSNGCQSGESCSTCAKDCGMCAQSPSCGDALCNNGETCTTCASDCGSCPTTNNCGNGACDSGETCSTCATDCGECAYCGDATCNNGETCTSCATDCGGCVSAAASKVALEAECPTTSIGAYSSASTARASFVGSGHLLSVGNQTSGGDSSSDKATYEVNLLAGTYKVWFRAHTNNHYEDDSWFYRIDGGAWQMNNNVYNSAWLWIPGGVAASSGTTSVPAGSGVTHVLTQGTHTIEIAGRENGLAIDRIYITKDGDTPSGNGDAATNCNPPSAGDCGNSSCAPAESCTSCAKDCGACERGQLCGDAVCEGTETCANCTTDCGACTGTANCGNGSCGTGENCTNCAKDCGKCADPLCGNSVCDTGSGETCTTCAIDCDPCSLTAICSDGICEPSEESCATCTSDCGTCLSADTCGNDVCEDAESCESCATDCGVCGTCGDSTCDTDEGETCGTCALDCGTCMDRSVCGDGECDTDAAEDCSSCATDCTACPLDSYCGDASCDTEDGEDCSRCAKDCDPCVVSECGNDICEAAEDCTICPEDCSDCVPMCPAPPDPIPYCGDALCDASQGETCGTCETDCGKCPSAALANCGNGTCSSSEGEDCTNCPSDCGACAANRYCGDGLCEASLGESCGVSVCQTDCGVCKPTPNTNCGDGQCGFYENCGTCQADCGSCPTTGTGAMFNTGIIATGSAKVTPQVSIGGDLAIKSLVMDADSCIKGSVSVDGNATLKDRTKVGGTLRIEGSLTKGNNVSAPSVEMPTSVTLPVLPTKTVSPGGSNLSVNPDATVTINPGQYQNVLIGARSKTTFKPGRYDMASLKIEPDAKVYIDNAAGAVEWYIASSLEFESRTQYIVSDSTKWGIYSAGSIIVRPDVNLPASLYAPNGTVTVYSRVCVPGIAAKDVVIEPNVIVGGSCDATAVGQCQVGKVNVGWGTNSTPPPPAKTASCGDGYCTPESGPLGGENCNNCTADCGACATLPYCGDGSCNANKGENCGTCASDCGSCPVILACGDGTCNNGEDCGSCAKDCGACPLAPFCGDGSCDAAEGETCASCPGDCILECDAFMPIGYEEDYDISAECDFFEVPIWAAFSWEAITPGNAYVEMYFSSAETPEALDTATEVKIVVAASSASNGGWRYGPPAESAAMTSGYQFIDDMHIEENLPRHHPYARLRYWLVPTSDKQQAATLVRTALQSTCITTE